MTEPENRTRRHGRAVRPAPTQGEPGHQVAARQALTRQQLRAHPVVFHYMLFCLAALFLMVVCLADRGMEWWCLVPASIGCLALLTNWNFGPPMVLLSLAGLLSITSPRSRGGYAGWPSFLMPTMMEMLLCLAVLAYVVANYRLLSLMRYIFAPDLRHVSRRSPPHPSLCRSPELVQGWETALLGFALPVWVGLAVIVWAWLMRGSFENELPWGISRPIWRALQVVWISLAVLAVTGVVASYVRWTKATLEESLLFLQDQCWRQTRREQSNLNRWLTWARLRAQRKKEAS